MQKIKKAISFQQKLMPRLFRLKRQRYRL